MPAIDIGKDRFLVLTNDAEPVPLDTGFRTCRNGNCVPSSGEIWAISTPDGLPISGHPSSGTTFLRLLCLFSCSLSLEPLPFLRNEHLHPSHQFRLFQYLREINLDVVLVEDRFQCADRERGDIGLRKGDEAED